MVATPLDLIVQPYRRTYDEVERELAKPNVPLVSKFIGAGRAVACGIYKNSPAAFVNNALAGQGVLSPQYLLMENLCRPIGEAPPDPTVPFSGAQCDGTAYRMYFSIVDIPGSNIPDCGLRSYFGVGERAIVFGPVSGVQLQAFAPIPGNCDQGGYGEVWATCRGTVGTGLLPLGFYKVYVFGESTMESIGELSFSDGSGSGADLCGSPPLSFPPSLPPAPSLTTNVNIQVTPTLNVPVNVEIKPTLNLNANVFAPVLLVNVGGIDVSFDLGGVTIAPTVNNNTTQNFPTTQNPDPDPVTVKNPPAGGSTPVDLTPILDRLNEVEDIIERCCDRLSPFGEPTTDEYDIAILGTGVSGTYNLPSKTFRVTVQVLTSPPHRKEIFGNGNPNVLFCGWAWFDRGGGLSERMPIDAEQKSYEPPARSQGTFVFSMYTGYTAEVRAYFAKSTATP
jgi:hypothetical protein